jgi:hypothetical protein
LTEKRERLSAALDKRTHLVELTVGGVALRSKDSPMKLTLAKAYLMIYAGGIEK